MDDHGHAPPDPADEPGADTPKAKPKRLIHTIASLMLDMEAARAGKPWLLLPRGPRGRVGGGREYPLPTAYQELKRLAELPFKAKGRDETTAYLRRARRRLTQHTSKNDVALGVLTNATAVKKASGEIGATLKDAKQKIAAAVADVQAEAIKAAASLTDLYGLTRAHAARVLEAALKDAPINGEVPTIDQATNVMKAILGHVAKMGAGILAPDEKDEAEDAIVEQYMAATRARLLKEKGGETEH